MKDNKVVTLLSNYPGALSVTEISKCDKKKIGVTCPLIVKKYN